MEQVGGDREALERIAERLNEDFPDAEIVERKGNSLFANSPVLFLGETRYEGRFTSACYYITVTPVRCIRVDVFSSEGYQFSLGTFYSGLRDRLRLLQELVASLSSSSQEPDSTELERINVYKLRLSLG